LNLQQAYDMRLLIVLFALSALLAGCERDSGVQRQGSADEGKAIRQAGR
jgi:predicted small secreted protein